jgi:hypothetical protein
VTRKTQILLVTAAALVGLAGATALWLTHDDGASQTQNTPAPAQPDGPPDPQALSEVRKAYQDELAKDAPPGMIELMQGPDKGQTKPGELPPLPDPFVVPAGHQSGGSSGELPPLDPVPAAKPAAKEARPPNLPPLPPLPGEKDGKPADPPR